MMISTNEDSLLFFCVISNCGIYVFSKGNGDYLSFRNSRSSFFNPSYDHIEILRYPVTNANVTVPYLYQGETSKWIKRPVVYTLQVKTV